MPLPAPATPARLQAFLTKWEASGAAERANAQLFLAELCDIIGVERPQPKGPIEADNAYCFEKAIANAAAGTTNYIDLYKRGCFVLETKQGVDPIGAGAGAGVRAMPASPATPPPLSAEGAHRQRTRKTGHGIRGTIITTNEF